MRGVGKSQHPSQPKVLLAILPTSSRVNFQNQQVGKSFLWLYPIVDGEVEFSTVARHFEDENDEESRACDGVLPLPQELAKEPSGGRVCGVAE